MSEFAKFTVPADPSEVFDGTKPFSRPMSPQDQENIRTLYWIPRHELVELTMDEIQSKQRKDNGRAVIEFRRNAHCHDIEPTEDGSKVKIVREGKGKGDTGDGNNDDDNDINDNVLVADLCVMADRANTSVKKSLEDGQFDPLKWSNAKHASIRFRLKRYITPLTGLRIKGMRMAPNFAIPKGGNADFDTLSKDQAFEELGPRHNYMLDSTMKGSLDKLRLYSVAARPINI